MKDLLWFAFGAVGAGAVVFFVLRQKSCPECPPLPKPLTITKEVCNYSDGSAKLAHAAVMALPLKSTLGMLAHHANITTDAEFLRNKSWFSAALKEAEANCQKIIDKIGVQEQKVIV